MDQNIMEIKNLSGSNHFEKIVAVLYYTSWWDFGGIKFEIGGMDPNCRHPKPRPTTPHDFFWLNSFSVPKSKSGEQPFKNSSQQNPTNAQWRKPLTKAIATLKPTFTFLGRDFAK